MVRVDPEALLRQRAHVWALADVYGPLLTDRQREMLRLYYGEDLSLAEVAERFGVSRQAIHDLLRRAVVALEGYEGKLGWARQGQERRLRLAQVAELLERARREAPIRAQALAEARALVRALAED